MKIKVGKRVGGIIIITMVTSFMLVYNSTSGDRSSSSSSSSHPSNGSASATKEPERPTASTLHGYTGVLDPKPLKMHCRTCSLVTSSGHLAGSKRGPEIDRAECVIRMNDAPSRHYQQDVGWRTSLRVIAHSSVYLLLRRRRELVDTNQDTVFVFWGPAISMRQDGKGLILNRLKMLKKLLPKLKLYTFSRLKILMLDELFKKETGRDRKGSNSWLSTGWFTMVIAQEMCDRIDVYGMVPPDFCSQSPSHPPVPYHYYEPRGPNECSVYLSHERGRHGGHHRFITEKAVFANWARTHDIHFYQPDWKPPAVSNASHALAPPIS